MYFRIGGNADIKAAPLGDGADQMCRRWEAVGVRLKSGTVAGRITAQGDNVLYPSRRVSINHCHNLGPVGSGTGQVAGDRGSAAGRHRFKRT
jgi:hypothetical protein